MFKRQLQVKRQSACVQRTNCASRMTYPGLAFRVRWQDKVIHEGLFHQGIILPCLGLQILPRKCKSCRLGDTRGKVPNYQFLISEAGCGTIHLYFSAFKGHEHRMALNKAKPTLALEQRKGQKHLRFGSQPSQNSSRALTTQPTTPTHQKNKESG